MTFYIHVKKPSSNGRPEKRTVTKKTPFYRGFERKKSAICRDDRMQKYSETTGIYMVFRRSNFLNSRLTHNKNRTYCSSLILQVM